MDTADDTLLDEEVRGGAVDLDDDDVTADGRLLAVQRGGGAGKDLATASDRWERMHVLLAATKAQDAARDVLAHLESARSCAEPIALTHELETAMETVRTTIAQVEVLRVAVRRP